MEREARGAGSRGDRLGAIVATLNRINASDPNVDQVLDLVLDQARSLTDAAGAVVELAEGEEMVYRAASGNAAANIGLRLKLSSSLSGLCVRLNQVLRCDDTETDERVDREACRRIGARSMLVAPLVHRDAVVGVLKVFTSEPHGFDADDVDTLHILAGFIAATLSRAAQFETYLAQLQELRRLNEALEQFSAHVAHDLRSPLAVISMGVETLRKLQRHPDPDVAVVLDMVHANVDRSLGIVTDLLRLARASRSPNVECFDLGDLVDETVADETGARIDNRCTAMPVEADRGAVRQAIANLVSNAIRYAGGPDGRAEVTIACDSTVEWWRVVVADRGPGVPVDEREQIFGAFVRGRTTTPSDGTGLGLALVAAVARAHGGEFGCDDRPGGGAVFWFTVPRTRAVDPVA